MTVPGPFADCEARDDWLFEQDVNTWSSLAYLAVALVLLRGVRRGAQPRPFLPLSAVLALVGVGSVLFHGAGGASAQLVHDVSLVGLLGFVVGWHVGRLFGAAPRGAFLGSGAGLVGAGLLGATTPGATAVVTAVLVTVLVGTELWARRRALPAVGHVGLAVLVVLAGLAWVAGTPSSPLCEAGSLVQPHALWHVLSALAVLAWAGQAHLAERG